MEFSSIIRNTTLSQNIISRLENIGAVFPIIAYYSNTKFLQVVEDLVTLGAVDTENTGGYIPEYQSPDAKESTSVYVIDKRDVSEQKMQELCNRYNYVVTILDEEVLVTKGTSLCFIPVPAHVKARMFRYMLNRDVFYGITTKAGCTFITKHLSENSKEKDLEFRKDALIYMARILSRTSKTYKFTVVRNPYSRLVSCYKDIIAGEVDIPCSRNVFFRRCAGLPVSGYISFEAFVNHIETIGFAWVPEAEHWLPQVTCCSYASIAYNDIGRFEQMNEFLTNTVSPKLREAGDTRSIIFPTNKPERVSGASNTWKDYYTSQDIINRVYKLYEIDFDTFKYSYKIK